MRSWLIKGNLPEFIFINGNVHKKGLEFFFSSLILDINENDIVLDAAGGRSNYLKSVKLNSNTNELILTDHIYEGINEDKDGIKIVGGNIASIHLSDSSVNKIACHHAFEHFKENTDISFIKESYRILKTGGVLVIIPLFLTDKYYECWNIQRFNQFDTNSYLIIDKTSTLPGGDEDGHFARLYSNESLNKRIIDSAKIIGFNCEIVECRVNDKSIPNMYENFGSKLNNPTRALKFIKE